MPSNYGVVRKVNIQYKNVNESSFRETCRSVRYIVVIHRIDETDLVTDILFNIIYYYIKKTQFLFQFSPLSRQEFHCLSFVVSF